MVSAKSCAGFALAVASSLQYYGVARGGRIAVVPPAPFPGLHPSQDLRPGGRCPGVSGSAAWGVLAACLLEFGSQPLHCK